MPRSIPGQLVAMTLFAVIGGVLWWKDPASPLSGLCGMMVLVLGVSVSKPFHRWHQEENARRR